MYCSFSWVSMRGTVSIIPPPHTYGANRVRECNRIVGCGAIDRRGLRRAWKAKVSSLFFNVSPQAVLVRPLYLNTYSTYMRMYASTMYLCMNVCMYVYKLNQHWHKRLDFAPPFSCYCYFYLLYLLLYLHTCCNNNKSGMD